MYTFFGRVLAEDPPPREQMSDLQRLAEEDPEVKRAFLVGRLLGTASPHLISIFAWSLCTHWAFPDDVGEAAAMTLNCDLATISVERALPPCVCFRR